MKRNSRKSYLLTVLLVVCFVGIFFYHQTIISAKDEQISHLQQELENCNSNLSSTTKCQPVDSGMEADVKELKAEMNSLIEKLQMEKNKKGGRAKGRGGQEELDNSFVNKLKPTSQKVLDTNEERKQETDAKIKKGNELYYQGPVRYGYPENRPRVNPSWKGGCRGFKPFFDRAGDYEDFQQGVFHKTDCPFYADNYENWPRMPHLCEIMSLDCHSLHGSAHHLYGISSAAHQQSLADFIFFDFFLTKHKEVRDFIELGTMGGLSSIYYGTVSLMRNGIFHSYDINENRYGESQTAWLPNMHIHKEDILTFNTNVSNHLMGMPCPGGVAFFDNGNKTQEIRQYAKYISEGCYLITHDWNNEITIVDVIDVLTSLNFTPLYWDFAEHIGTELRLWRKD